MFAQYFFYKKSPKNLSVFQNGAGLVCEIIYLKNYIVNVLLEVRKLLKEKMSFFSGINLDVDKEKNLNGFCDFIISKSPEQFYLNAPIITIVEAKNENITLN